MTYVFIHIPKTAGSSFIGILQKNFKRQKSFYVSNMFSEESIKFLYSLDKNDLNSFDLVAGHNTHQIVGRMESPILIAFFRDPINQFISGYHHIRNNPQNRFHNAVKKCEDLEEYISLCDHHEWFNQATRYLNNGSNPSKTEFRKVKSFVSDIQYPLITESFNESILQISRLLERQPSKYLSKNVAGRDTIISTQTIEKIRERQHFDLELFEIAFNKFQENSRKLMISQEAINVYEKSLRKHVALYSPLNFLKRKALYYLERGGFYEPNWRKKPLYQIPR